MRGECMYLQYLVNYNYYCTLCDESGLTHPECACSGCKDYRYGRVELVKYAERVEISE